MADALVGLAESIEALRAELSRAVAEGANQPMRFQLEPIELTLEVAVTKDVNGKVGWKVLEFGGSRESVTTQSLTLNLRPFWKKPDGTFTGDFVIADTGRSGQHFGPRSGPPTASDSASPTTR